MKKIIKDKLFQIEEEYQIKILFSCESGSRAWGFPSPDSDYDVRFIYVRSLEHYLSVYKKPDQIGFPIKDEFDIYGWDLSKTLQLISKSNTTLFEWLQSPIIYMEDKVFHTDLWDLCQHYSCPRSNAHHYLGIARGAIDTIDGNMIGIKKLFYILRPLLSALWCIERKGIAPMTIHPLMELLSPSLSDKVLSLIELKSTVNEGFSISLEDDMIKWIEETYSYCTEKSDLLDKMQFDRDPIDKFFRQIVLKYDNR